MTPQDLIAAFDTLAEAPDGVTRLRELALQLAVRGKLVPQDSEDEPASVLLERIAEEKALLVKEKKIRKPKALPPVSEDEVPFEVPEGWSWTRLGLLALQIHYGHTASADHDNRENRFLRITDIQNNRVNWPSVPGCTIKPKDVDKYRLADDDIVIARTGGTVGKSYLVEGLGDLCAVFASYLIRVAPPSGTNSAYLKRALETPLYWQQLIDRTAGTGQPNVNATSLGTLLIPVPPLAEQKRIVARVDELMGLLDRLEAARNTRDATRTALRDAALAALREADTPEEVEVAWERIAGRMDDLFTDPTDVDPLRQTVLQLAVRGRLVPQDPNDEPASVLLERATAQDTKLSTLVKRVRKESPADESPPFEAAAGWEWARFADLCSVVTVGHVGSMASRYVPSGVPFLRSQNVREFRFSPVGLKFIRPEFHEELSKSTLLPGDILVVRSGNAGVACLVPDSLGAANCADLVVMRTNDALVPAFGCLYLNSAVAKVHVEGEKVGIAQRHFNTTSACRMPVPLPPKAEQERIIEAVGKFFGLLDRLEGHLRSKTTAHDAFAAAAVHHLDA